MYNGPKYKLFFIDDYQKKQYICEDKPTLQAESVIYHNNDVSKAHLFSASSPDHAKQWLERKHHYVNLEAEYV